MGTDRAALDHITLTSRAVSAEDRRAEPGLA
jgi:hypothetical protein